MPAPDDAGADIAVDAPAESAPDAPEVMTSVDLQTPGAMVLEASRTLDGGLLVLLERPGPIREVETFERVLVRVDAAGRFLARYTPPAGAWLLNAAVHPSSEVTLLLATDDAYRLVRRDGRLGALAEASVETFRPPHWSRDTARLASAGEDVVVALRDKDHAVWLDRYTPLFARTVRTQIEPSFELFPAFLTSGSFDPFHQLRVPYHLALDVDVGGNAYVAVATARADELFARHQEVFGDGLHGIFDGNEDGKLDHLAADAIVTRVDVDGTRRWAHVHGTKVFDEPHALRVRGDSLYVLGRSEVNKGASDGWDAWLSKAPTTTGVMSWSRNLHTDRGEIAFDLGARGDRLFVAAGAGYDDNPTGFSITETCAPVVFELSAQGVVGTAHRLTAGSRQTYPRTIVDLGPRWFLGGITDGPGTHSHDGDPSALHASTWTELWP